MSKLATINFKKWIDENRHLLKPPVGNKCIVDGAARAVFGQAVVGHPHGQLAATQLLQAGRGDAGRAQRREQGD